MAVVLAAAVWIFSVVVLLASLYVGAGLRCDESCDGSTWRHSSGAWQWDLIVGAGVVAFAAGTTFLIAIARGRRVVAAGALAIGVAVTVVAGSAVEPDWWDHLDRHFGATVLCLAVIASGLVATLSAPSRKTA